MPNLPRSVSEFNDVRLVSPDLKTVINITFLGTKTLEISFNSKHEHNMENKLKIDRVSISFHTTDIHLQIQRSFLGKKIKKKIYSSGSLKALVILRKIMHMLRYELFFNILALKDLSRCLTIQRTFSSHIYETIQKYEQMVRNIHKGLQTRIISIAR